MKLNTHRAYSLVAGAILASVLCGSAEAPQNQSQSVAPAKHAAGSRLTLEGVGNLGQVTPTLFRGGQPKPAGFSALAKMGINIVVDVRLSGKDKERKEVEKAGMQYVSMPWHCLFPRDDVFARFLALLRANPGKKVFVHCRYGDDRTGMMIAAYRMSVEGWTAEEARKEMEQFGFHRLVCPSLGPYEKSFPERVKKDPALQSSLPATK
jgi:protein tyrosine/serine phosphatase